MFQNPDTAFDQKASGIGRITLAACAALMLSVSGSPAQEQDDLSAFANRLSPDILKQLGRAKGQYLQQAATQIYSYAPDGVLTKDAIDIVEQQHAAKARAKHLTAILGHDLNGDFRISQDEIQKQAHLINQHTKGQLALAFAGFDADGDDILTAAELSAFFDSLGTNRFRREQLDQYLAFDFNKDGQVDVAEISMVANAINPDVLEVSAKRKTSRKNAITARCLAPAVPSGHDVVLVSGYQGPATSNIAVNGQDSTTTVASIIVEPGDTPLYVFAVARGPIVWKFEGATDRIKQIVVQPGNNAAGPGAAVQGVDAKAVTFVAPRSCVSKYTSKTGPELNALTKELSAKLSTRIAYPVATYTLDHVQIPSGIPAEDRQAGAGRPYRTPVDISVGSNRYRLDVTGMVALDAEGNPKTEPGPERQTIREMIRFFRGGLTPFSAEELIAPAKVEPYDVLPDQAGLLQLIADGKLQVLPNRTYRIVADIPRYPAGLTGSHLVTFVVADGVQLPPGRPGHSSVILEETGTCIIGARC